MPIVAANNDTGVIYVSVDGSDDGDGSLENPYYNITRALSDDSETIILTNGNYAQSNININKSVSILGLDDVIINGDGNWILNISNSKSTVNLANLTFINAYSTGFGAAIINNAILTVDECKFINNSARSAPAIDNAGNLTLINSYFSGNDAYGRDGGALSNMADATIINSTFVNNSASRNAGAIKSQGKSFKIFNSTFINNTAFGNDNFGGAVYIWASKGEIYNSRFFQNHGGYGGAVFISGGSMETTALTINGSIFADNKALVGNDIDIEEGHANVSYSKLLSGVQVFKTTEAILDYNWWGSNAPDWKGIIASPKPKVYAVLNLSSEGENVKTGVDWINSSDAVSNIPELIGIIEIDSKIDYVNFTREFEFNATKGSNVTVSLDKEVQNLIVESQIQTILTANDVEKYFGGNERLYLNLTSQNGDLLSNKSIIININDVEYIRQTNEQGVASIGLNLNSGKYVVVAHYISDDEKYTSSNSTVRVNVLATVNASDIVKVYRNATQYYATFRDSEGNYLADGTMVSFNINGVYYNRTVGNNGLARLNLNLEQGNYVLTSINPVTHDNCANNVTVMSRICDNKDLVKYYRNETQYTVKLLGDDGNPVGAGENVIFNINGVLYTRQTNESGIAKLNINLKPDDYVITAEYNGCRVSNNIRVLNVLIASDISMNYKDGTKFKSLVLDGHGNPNPNQEVTFNINGIFYNRYTNATGFANLNINLMSGKYIITTSYNGLNSANTIIIH